jgi:hypothetical protein
MITTAAFALLVVGVILLCWLLPPERPTRGDYRRTFQPRHRA